MPSQIHLASTQAGGMSAIVCQWPSVLLTRSWAPPPTKITPASSIPESRILILTSQLQLADLLLRILLRTRRKRKRRLLLRLLLNWLRRQLSLKFQGREGKMMILSQSLRRAGYQMNLLLKHQLFQQHQDWQLKISI